MLGVRTPIGEKMFELLAVAVGLEVVVVLVLQKMP
jgi:hypothetical protein